MPDVDWERVAEALFTAERLESNYERGLDDRMVVEPEVLAAARWGLEAQQRGVEAHLSSEPLDIDGLMWRVTVPHVLGTYMEGPHLLVPLEGEQ